MSHKRFDSGRGSRQVDGVLAGVGTRHECPQPEACFKASLWKTRKGLCARAVPIPERSLPLFGVLAEAQAGIGSVIREQRPARATTRTTGCSLKAGSDESYPTANAVNRAAAVAVSVQHITDIDGAVIAPRLDKDNKLPRFAFGGLARSSQSEIRTDSLLAFKELRWSSRPRPVNRLQATGEPRRVMRGGRKAVRLAPRNRTDPTCGKPQGKLSLSPRNRGSGSCSLLSLPRLSLLPFPTSGLGVLGI